MPENFSDIIVLLFLILWLILTVRLICKAARNKYAPVKTVKAEVIDKTVVKSFSKYSGSGKREKYAVVFSAEGRKLSFYVSEFSYRGYNLKETGTLKYKGEKLIDFS